MWLKYQEGENGDVYLFNINTRNTVAVEMRYDGYENIYWAFTVNEAVVAANYERANMLKLIDNMMNLSVDNKISDFTAVNPKKLFKQMRGAIQRPEGVE